MVCLAVKGQQLGEGFGCQPLPRCTQVSAGGHCHFPQRLSAAAVHHHPADLVPSPPEAVLGPGVPGMDLGLLWVSHTGSSHSISLCHSAVKLVPGKGQPGKVSRQDPHFTINQVGIFLIPVPADAVGLS